MKHAGFFAALVAGGVLLVGLAVHVIASL